MQQLRANGIASELYHEQTKMDKQFKYAEKKQIPFVVIIGANELASSTCNIKELSTGNQQSIETLKFISHIHQIINLL